MHVGHGIELLYVNYEEVLRVHIWDLHVCMQRTYQLHMLTNLWIGCFFNP